MILPQQFLGVQRFHPNNPNNLGVDPVASSNSHSMPQSFIIIYQPPKKRWISRWSCGKSFYQHVRPGRTVWGWVGFSTCKFSGASGIMEYVLTLYCWYSHLEGNKACNYSRTCWFIKPSFTDDFTFVCFWWCLPPHYLFAVCWFFSHLIPFVLRYIKFHLKWTHPPVAAADELTGDQTTDCNFRRWVDQIICKMGCWSEKNKNDGGKLVKLWMVGYVDVFMFLFYTWGYIRP